MSVHSYHKKQQRKTRKNTLKVIIILQQKERLQLSAHCCLMLCGYLDGKI
jgi:hypothetical protein